MGLISAVTGSVSSALHDTWRDYFYCDSLSTEILVTKGVKREKGGLFSKKDESNVISNGSIICVAEGQCMLIVDQGKITDVCAEPGEFLYDTSSQPSIFYGSLGSNILATLGQIGERISFGGITPNDQRVYYVNIKELTGNKYGTVAPVPFRIVDNNIGLDLDTAVRCHGEYSYRICNPLLFFTNVCGNVSVDFKRSSIEGQLKSELMTAMQPAFAKISEMGIRYSALPGHTEDLSNAMNEVLSEKWSKVRGLEIVSFGVTSVTIPPEDEERIKKYQEMAILSNGKMASAYIIGKDGEAKVAAASNAAGAINGFMGLNMAGGGAGANSVEAAMNFLNQQATPQQAAPAQPAADSWTCSCGAVNTGKFCAECGSPKPAPAGSWTCSCGAVNTGKFCSECGSPKPSTDWTCECGTVNSGKFCANCGKPRP